MNRIDTSSAARHQWLEQATAALRPRFQAAGYNVPAEVRVSIGWPKGGGSRQHRIGECWAPQASSDKYSEIFVSPELKDSVRILGVLAHELVHATVGCEAGHKAPFKRAAEAVGLTGKMTATTESESFVAWAQTVIQTIGQYPAGALTQNSRKKQTTRMIKCTCEDCGYTVRTTAKWIEAAGAPICPADEIQMSCS